MFINELNSKVESGHSYESADIYIPIGPACRPVELLKRHGLKNFATPLDSKKIIIYGAGVNAGLMINLLNSRSFEVFAVAVRKSRGIYLN